MRKVLGVSLGRASAEIAVAASGIGGVKPLRSVRAVLPAGPEEMSAALNDMLRKWTADHAPDGMVAALPLQQFSQHLLEMPAMGRQDMLRALSFDLEKYLPLPVEEYVFDFIPAPSAKGQNRVLVFCLRRSVAEGLARAAADAGLRLRGIRSSTIETFCGLIEAAGAPRFSGVAVIATDDAYELVAARDGRPAQIKGLPKTADLAAEVSRMSAAFHGEVLCAGVMDEVTAARLGGRKVEVPAGYAAARSGLRRSGLHMDFLPPEFLVAGRDPYPFLIGGLAAAALILFLATGMTAYLKDRYALGRLEARLSAIRKDAAGALKERKRLEELRVEKKALGDFRGKSNSAIRVLRALSGILPKDAWLINLTVDDKGMVEMEGLASKTSTVVTAIEKSGAFRNITFSAPIISRDNMERFALKMETEGI